MQARKAMIMLWMLRMTCAIALLLVSFAHQMPSLAKEAFVPAEFAEYILPDGTLPVICIADKATGMDKHTAQQLHGCEACRIAASVLLPVPDNDRSKHLPAATLALWHYDVEVSFRRIISPNTGPRAPPGSPAFA
ncbi:hypothetical protein [Rhizobium grahamii]|uniref:DUF2946 domain-containing protein n=1 Tax=Rhizobium grahamii CCGE 502 TaxID=990285 RepID=S3HNI7_9HYPH|nr:hypothetical protein [Rhizobium grahamii]EPE94971.1 hypothetical protein RGCCGE502_27638 [Rhizobium grahamii CCGE 502]